MPPDVGSQQPVHNLTDQLGLLASPRPRWRAFIVGFIFQAIMCSILAKNAFYDFVRVPPEQNMEVTELYAPSLRAEPVAPTLRLNIAPHPVNAMPEVVHRLPAPTPQQSPPEVILALRFRSPQSDPEIPVLKSSPIPRLKPETRLNQFPGSSATATLKLPATRVQTGGFGDPNGVPANPNAHGAVAIAQVGQFELPGGPGWGNGTGGSHGVRGTVVSAGFGNGVAGHGQGSGLSRRASGVRDSGFNDSVPQAPAVPKIASESKPPLVPAEVLSKPRPSYTPEARQKRIEGEVILDVIFGADGHLRVLKVVSGLGYGLDESAVQAAERIQFKPATRNGQPVDSTARIRVTFQLA